MRTTILLALLFSLAGKLASQATLSVLDPDRTWNLKQGSVEAAALTIEPQGIYADVGLFLTLSAEGASFPNADSLEIVLDFSLPEEALVYDSWLWVDTIIVRADILDRRTATTIYEEIVNRRQDPSILFKKGPGQYQLRVYPLPVNGSRRLKISYLMPADWTAESVSFELPMEIINASNTPPDSLELRAWMGPEWGQPYIPELPDQAFQWFQSPELGPFSRTAILPENFRGSLTFAMDAPLDNGVYVNRNDSLNIYQAVVLPEQLLNLPEGPGRNLFILLDYKLDNTNNLSPADLLEALRTELLAGLTPADTFMLWTSTTTPFGLESLMAGPMPGEEGVIQAVFDALGPGLDLPENGYLPAAIDGLLQLIEAENRPADILLASNSQSEGDPQYAESLIEDITDAPGFALAAFHVIDYQNTNISGWWDWWTGLEFDWKGNEFFYSELSRLSGGSYRRAGQYRYKLRKALEAADRLRGSVELHTSMSNGFCYNRFLLGGSTVNVPLRRPLYQVGKYQGAFPLTLQYAAFTDGMPQMAGLSVDEALVNAIDTLAEEIWVGNYLLSLEGSAQGDATVEEIVEQSIEHRVLSLHTAFLCLEPNQGGEPCIDCIDPTQGGGPIVIGTAEEEGGENNLLWVEAFPNPFARQQSIRIGHRKGIGLAGLRIAIYDSMGRLVALPDTDGVFQNGELTLLWDGRSLDGRELPPGVYFLIADSPQGGQVQLKLVKI